MKKPYTVGDIYLANNVHLYRLEIVFFDKGGGFFKTILVDKKGKISLLSHTKPYSFWIKL